MSIRKWVFWFGMLCSLQFGGLAHAQQPEPADIVVYINPLEYKHQIKLWHFFYEHWYHQGPVVEKVAMEVLNEAYGKASMCDGNNIGKVLIRIVPNMFYNPHMTMFYGKLTVDVFTGSGKPIGTYVTEANTFGFLDVAPADKVARTYREAMQNIANELKKDPAVQDAITHGVPQSETSTPCSMMSVLPARRFEPKDLLRPFER